MRSRGFNSLPVKVAARQPEASFARTMATPLVKRKQQILKPGVSLEIIISAGAFGVTFPGAASTGPQRARPAGPAGVLEPGKGMGWNAREPERSRACPRAGRRRGETG